AEYFQEIYTNACGRAQSGTGRDFGSQEQISGKIHPQILEHRERNLEPAILSGQRRKVAPVPEQPQVGGDDLDAAIAAVAQNRIEILVDGRAEDGATELLIVRGKIGTASAKTNPNRTASDEHAVISPEKPECWGNIRWMAVHRLRGHRRVAC